LKAPSRVKFSLYAWKKIHSSVTSAFYKFLKQRLAQIPVPIAYDVSRCCELLSQNVCILVDPASFPLLSCRRMWKIHASKRCTHGVASIRPFKPTGSWMESTGCIGVHDGLCTSNSAFIPKQPKKLSPWGETRGPILTSPAFLALTPCTAKAKCYHFHEAR